MNGVEKENILYIAFFFALAYIVAYNPIRSICFGNWLEEEQKTTTRKKM